MSPTKLCDDADVFTKKLDLSDDLVMEESEIRKFFTGANVMITGGTGFLGKLMVEKLLRICPEIEKIFLLVRPKKGTDPWERIHKQFQDVLYEKMRKCCPNYINKIEIVEGDVSQKGLGLSTEDRKKITSQVDVIFHGAATVRFDEKIKTSVEINVRGTKEMLILARQSCKLKAFVHTSTAYSNCIRPDIDEILYPSPINCDTLLNMIETIDESLLEAITPGLLDKYPNTYAYTKAVAEDVVRQYSHGLPVAIVRPAIVIATDKEPVSGWIDNVYGPTGVVVGAAVGLLHSLYCEPNILADLVPGDHVVNCTIAVAYNIATSRCNNTESAPNETSPPIFNYVSSAQNPLTWSEFMAYNEFYGRSCPTPEAIWYYVFMLVPNRFLHMTITFFMHWIPAYIIDGIAMILGKEKRMVKTYTKIHKFSEVISYFCIQQWKFDNKNTVNLYEQLNETDKSLFNFDMSKLKWDEYFSEYIRGVRVYLLNDPLDTIPRGIRKHRILKFAHYTLVSVLLFLFFRFILFIYRLF